MWLTGFDVPPLHTLYMDKFLSGHNLMQAIARVNHVYKDKPAGLVVDDLGYEAVAQNESARELMSKDNLKELAIAVFNTLKQNITLDWQHKENVRAKIRVAVKRVLKKYGYPPDMQKLAVDMVIKQAELIAENLAKIV